MTHEGCGQRGGVYATGRKRWQDWLGPDQGASVACHSVVAFIPGLGSFLLVYSEV